MTTGQRRRESPGPDPDYEDRPEDRAKIATKEKRRKRFVKQGRSRAGAKKGEGLSKGIN